MRSLLTISARPGQGSTNTIANLGITLAQSGHRVILVDANTRNPQLHEIFEIPNDFGLTNALESPDIFAIKRALRPTSVPNLWVMPSGPASGNPWELFSSQRLAEVGKFLLERADYVLYDAPPATTFTDTLNLATVADAALLSVRALEPLTGEEARLVERFEQAGTHVMGSVLSHVPLSLLESYRTAAPVRASRSLPASAQDERFDNLDVVSGTQKLDSRNAPGADALPPPHFEPFVRVAPVAEFAAPVAEAVPPVLEPAVGEPIAQAEPIENAKAEAEKSDAQVFMYRAGDDANAEPVAAPYMPVHAKEPTIEVENAPQRANAEELKTAEANPAPSLHYFEMETNPNYYTTQEENPAAAADFAPSAEFLWDEEAFMSSPTLPQTEFPRAMSGYAPSAVEEYVRLANTRVELMQQQIEQQSAMTARLMDEKDRMTAELELARHQMTASLEKEVSIASAILMTEQRRVQIEQEMEEERSASRVEIEQIRAQAQVDAERLMAQAREQADTERLQAEELKARAREQADAQQRQAELTAMQALQHQQDMAAERAKALAESEQMREQAKAEIAAMIQEAKYQAEARRAAEMETERASLRAEVEQRMAEARTEAERLKADARTEAERIAAQARHEATAQMEEAKHHAEEISMYAAAAHSAHEERLQALSAECDEIVGRTRKALETQLALLPPPASADNVRSSLQEALSAATRLEASKGPSSYAPVRGEWPDESLWRSENGNGKSGVENTRH